MYGEVVYLYTDPEASEPLIKRYQAYRQCTARITGWVDKLPHFDTSKKYTAAKILKLTDYLSKKPIGEPSTGENYEENVINLLSELLKLNHNYGQLLNTDRKHPSTDQWMNVALTSNRELTNENASFIHSGQNIESFQA